jgi:transketolase
MTRTEDLDQLCINTLRVLSADAVEAANSGHPETLLKCHTVQNGYLILHLGVLNSSNVMPYLPLFDYSA